MDELIQKPADRVLRHMALQLQSTQEHQDRQSVEAPEDDPLEIGVIDAQKEQELWIIKEETQSIRAVVMPSAFFSRPN